MSSVLLAELSTIADEVRYMRLSVYFSLTGMMKRERCFVTFQGTNTIRQGIIIYQGGVEKRFAWWETVWCNRLLFAVKIDISTTGIEDNLVTASQSEKISTLSSCVDRIQSITSEPIVGAAGGARSAASEPIAGSRVGTQSALAEPVAGVAVGARPGAPERIVDTFQAENERGGQRWKARLVALLEPGRSKGTIATLDGARAFACLLVVGYHISLITRDTRVWFPSLQPFVAAFLLAGEAGVTLFFVLSGFLLFLPYARALLQASAWPSARRFYLRRALRIIPAYYICLFALILLEHREYLQPNHWQQLVLFMTFFMDSSSATYQAINGPFWTLAVEWQFYLLLPLLVLGIRALSRRCASGRRLPTVLLCLLALLTWGAVSQVWGTYVQAHPWPAGPGWQISSALLFGQGGKYLQDFAIGMLAGSLYTYARNHERREKVCQKIQPWLWYVGLALLLFMALWHENAAHSNGSTWLDALKGAYPLCGEVGFASGFGLCMLALLFGHTRLQRFFALAPLRWIGNISYSTYMWHLPFLIFFMVSVGYHITMWNTWLVFACYWLWVLLIILPFSAVMFIVTERPGMWLAGRVR